MDDLLDNVGFELAVTVGAVIVGWVVILVVRGFLGRWSNRVEAQYATSDDHEAREQGQRLITLTSVIRLVLSIVVWVVVILTVMAVWGVPMAPLVTVGATLGVAVGFGAQDFVKDMIGGFFVLVEDQYSVDDVVQLAGVSGTVEAITLRTTVLRDLDGNRHHVPNGQVAVSTNYTSGFSRVVVDVTVSYDTNLDHASDVVADEAAAMSSSEEWEASFLEPPALLGVNRLGDSGIDIRIMLTTVPEERWNAKRAFLKRIKQRMDREGIEIPYQYVNVVAKNPSPQPDDASPDQP